MIYIDIKNITKRYDQTTANWVAKIPKSLQKISAGLGRVTLPSIWTIAIITSIFLHGAFNRPDWTVVGIVVLCFLPLSSLLKLFVRRSRPQTIYTETMRIKSYSFPSSHAYSAALGGGYMTAMAFLLVATPWDSLIGTAIVMLIIAIGISRIHVGAHYPSDVTAGWIAGAFVATTIVCSVLG